ncbi:MAG: hypothetical protein HC849_27800 [Oscillatoriales cyanobacterium RU_3_3]|nr:hypothetical protein [Microcoleus sp. SU_5_6]NJM63125.1 hypothetical protein [Oscillatoriales cyanobacterium RU_3_3]NJR23784.1 hypothetical protein [Richelia sp. CSU_2_1]
MGIDLAVDRAQQVRFVVRTSVRCDRLHTIYNDYCQDLGSADRGLFADRRAIVS